MVVNWRQRLFFLLVLLALLLGFIRDTKVAYTALTFVLCGFYGLVIAFRLISVFLGLATSSNSFPFNLARSLVGKSEHTVDAQDLAALKDEDLPVYTVLVPMYKEPEVAQKIARTVTHLDYPVDKLDVKLLLEEDDPETRAKVDEVLASLPSCVEVVIAPKVPKGQPRTKPRACNWGLERARGKYLVIFDAEDQPEPDQLKKAVVVFRKVEAAGKGQVACLQAKLNYFNPRQNWLTSYFTLEYTNWFDLFLPGLHAMRTPIPLGGTSNHFHTEVLRKLGGWDPFNVTEDCDLGIRMARQGYSTEILDSTTWEEANSQLYNWYKQRSRWIKGYFQTHLVHTRDAVLPMFALAAAFLFLYNVFEKCLSDPRLYGFKWWVEIFMGVAALAGILAAVMGVFSLFKRIGLRLSGRGRQLGPWRALTFRFTVGGMSLMLLLNVVFWTMTTIYLLRGPIDSILPSALANWKPPLSENATLHELLSDWKLYHTQVTNEQYANATVWNTVGGVVSGQFPMKEAAERIGAIDDWSLISQLFYPVAIMLFFANFVFMGLGLLSCQRRKLGDLYAFAILFPLYWVLISIAAIKGFCQLFTNPWYWEKTTHGLSHSQPAPPSTPGPVLGQATT